MYLLFIDNFVKLIDVKEKISQQTTDEKYADTF